MKNIFSCVDIGSSAIKIIVSEYFEKKLNVLASTSYPTSSIKKGVVVDDDLFEKDIKSAFNEVNKSLGVKVDKVITSIPIYDAEYTLVDGYTTITNDDYIINGNDMVNALQASIYNKLDKSRELVTIVPIRYTLDDNEKMVVKEPNGLQAKKLKAYAMMVTVPKKNIYKLITILEKIGVEVVDILFGSLGDYTIFKESYFDDETVGVINIGADKTELTTFNKGVITNSTILQDGSRDIDREISYVYNIKMSQAKRIKEIFSLANKEYASQSELYEITNKSGIKTKINQYEVSEIVENKLIELIQNSKKELNHLTKKEIRYIIVTGGISNIPGFDIICKDILKDQVITKKLNIIGIRDNSYSSCIGMIGYFINKLRIRGKAYTMFDEEKQIELIDGRRNEEFSNTSVFGKVFDYLVGNKED